MLEIFFAKNHTSSSDPYTMQKLFVCLLTKQASRFGSPRILHLCS